MKRLTIASVGCVVAIWGSSVLAAEPPLLLKGWQLFGSEKLGSAATSCATCHPDSSSLKGVSKANDEELAATINQCITGPLKGKALDPKSTEMKALRLYTRSVAKSSK